jgi:MSHA pilin protein MshC
MRWSSSQIEAIKYEAGRFHGAAQARMFGRMMSDNQCGFTLVELIMTMIIVGILGAVVAPRLLSTNVFQSRGFADQVQASLRYAQKEAIAQHRYVCVAFSSNSITLTINTTPVCPGGNLASPSGGTTYSVPAPTGITFSPTPTGFYFDALGKPSFPTSQTIIVSGAPNNIVVETETGYVHSP